MLFKTVFRDFAVATPRALVRHSFDLMLLKVVAHGVVPHVDTAPWARTILKQLHINKYRYTTLKYSE